MRVIYTMIISVLSLSFFSPFTEGSEVSRQEYLELIARYPDLVASKGEAAKGEIEIILDPDRMAVIEKNTARDVGVIKRDKYLIWINDACLFPSGKEGIYTRILWTKGLEGPYTGVAVLPVLPDGRIVLNCNYRHATRSWEVELPRGGLNKGETVEDAARRETLEETGRVISKLVMLGKMPPDSGLSGSIVPIFAAEVVGLEESQHEDFEAIEEIFALTPQEIKQGFLKGYIEHTIRGEARIVAFRDPFLTYALFLYELLN